MKMQLLLTGFATYKQGLQFNILLKCTVVHMQSCVPLKNNILLLSQLHANGVILSMWYYSWVIGNVLTAGFVC